MTAADLKKSDVVNKMSKEIIEGKSVEIVGHLVESENHLGRSLIIDLKAPKTNNFRQVDHRTIEWIILRNVKYTLGKKAPGTDELPLKFDKDAARWDPSKLEVGNWFSSTSYYKVREIVDKDTCKVITRGDNPHELQLSKDIMEYEMNSGSIYNKEEHISRSNLVEILINAKDCVFTATFNKQLDADYLKTSILSAPNTTWGNSSKVKDLSKELSLGPERTLTCRLVKNE